MAEPRHWYLFLYDVTDPKRLRRVHRVMTSWGAAVQLSVFRVRGTAREIERLRFELSKVMTEEDRLVVVRLCGQCVGRVTVRGRQLSAMEDEPPPFRML